MNDRLRGRQGVSRGFGKTHDFLSRIDVLGAQHGHASHHYLRQPTRIVSHWRKGTKDIRSRISQANQIFGI